MSAVAWLLAAVVLAVFVFVFWDAFVRGRSGAALGWSVAAMVALVAAGIAQALGASRWALLGLAVGGTLSVIAERRTREPASRATASDEKQ